MRIPRRCRGRFPALAAGAVLALVLTGCGSGTGSPSASGAAGPLPVIVDTDLSFDDLLALAFLARDPAVDLRAVTVVGTGLAHCDEGLQVVTSLLNTLDRTDLEPACGPKEPMAGGHPFPAEWRATADTAYGLTLDQLPVTIPDEDAPSLIASVAAASDAPVTILSLGPMTNLAAAFADHDGLAGDVARIVAMAGAVDVEGNVAEGDGWGPAEWNVYADPAAAAEALEAGVPITLVPLDATNDIPVTQAFIDAVEADHAAAPADVVYELLARRGIWDGDYLWDALAAVVMVAPAVSDYETARLAVVTDVGPDSGRTIRSDDGTEVTFATSADAGAFTDRFLEGLRIGAPRSNPFTTVATIGVTFDGTTCAEERPDPAAAGTWRLDGTSTGDLPTAIVLIRFHEGAGWNELLAYIASAPDPTAQPEFLDAPGYVVAEPGASARAFVTVEPGRYGVVCLFERDGVPDVVVGEGEFAVTAP